MPTLSPVHVGTGRTAYWDNLKLVLMVTVVFGHLIENVSSLNNFSYGLAAFIYSFHMPLFMFVSGFFDIHFGS